MNLKPEELVREAMRANPEEGIKELRKSSESTTKCCCAVQTINEWYKLLMREAADQIERDQKEIAELREENERLTAENAKAEAERDALTEQIKERHDCMNCKHNDFCDFDSYTVLDCMNCVQEGCPCAGCFDSSRWEWRGLPEAPEEHNGKENS